MPLNKETKPKSVKCFSESRLQGIALMYMSKNEAMNKTSLDRPN